MSTRFFTLASVLLGLAMVVAPIAEAKPGKGKGKPSAPGKAKPGKGKPDKGNPGKGKPDSPGKSVPPGQAKKDSHPHDHPAFEWNDARRKAACFHDHDRVLIHRHFDGYKGHPHGLPPGLAKNLARGKPLPPGWQKKLRAGWIIDDKWWPLFHLLGAADLPRGYRHPPGTGLYLFGDRLVRVFTPRREVVDVLPLPGVRFP